jgi:hypothetical protein
MAHGEAGMYWDMICCAYSYQDTAPAAGMEIGRLLWEGSGAVLFVPATSTSRGRLFCSGACQSSHLFVSHSLSAEIVEGLIAAARQQCGEDDWQSYVGDFFGVALEQRCA